MPNLSPRRSRLPLADKKLRAALTSRAVRASSLRLARPSHADAPSRLTIAINDLIAPTPLRRSPRPAGHAPTSLPFVEPIYTFWLDAANLARLTTLFAARQIDVPMPGSSRIPKLNLPAPLITLLTSWFNDHRDGARAAARAANNLAHYGLRLPAPPESPATRPRVQSSPILDAFHAVLLEALHRRAAPPDPNYLLSLLRRLHLLLSHSASQLVEGLPPPDPNIRARENLAIGRADLLIAQWLLSQPELTPALRGPTLVSYPQRWMGRLDALRHLTRTLDSLFPFYHDLASTSEPLLLSIRFNGWTRLTSTAAANWAAFWQPEIARYLVAYEEVTGIALRKAAH